MQKQTKDGWICFFIHVLVEIICFSILTHTFRINTGTAATVFFGFDFLAFVPQFLVGILAEKFPRLNIWAAGILLMLAGLILTKL